MEQFVSGFGAYSGLRRSFTTPLVGVLATLGGSLVGTPPGPTACGLAAARLWTGYFHVAILYFSTSLGPSTSASFPSDSQVHARTNTLSRGRTCFSGARWQLRHHSI